MLLLWYSMCLFSVMYAEMFEEINLCNNVASINCVIKYSRHYIHFNEANLKMVLGKKTGVLQRVIHSKLEFLQF